MTNTHTLNQIYSIINLVATNHNMVQATFNGPESELNALQNLESYYVWTEYIGSDAVMGAENAIVTQQVTLNIGCAARLNSDRSNYQDVQSDTLSILNGISIMLAEHPLFTELELEMLSVTSAPKESFTDMDDIGNIMTITLAYPERRTPCNLPFNALDGYTYSLANNVFQYSIAGETGAQGPRGFQGATGAQGVQGTTGLQGNQGAQGDRGFQGAQGNIGTQGNTGATGLQGNQGSQGNQGAVGAGVQGAIGSQGVQGATGPQGFTGISGVTGPQGNTGNTGATGLQGSQGVQGNQGNQGSTGSQGAQGNTGATGLQGPQGNTGATGLQGNQGSQGNQGATGTGVQGAQGNQGNQGIQGATGPQGFTGAGVQGPQGNTGTIGATGSIGATGPQGNTGAGVQGPIGPTGPAGSGSSGGGLSGLTAGYIIKAISATAVSGSVMYETGTNIYVGTTTAYTFGGARMTINGNLTVTETGNANALVSGYYAGTDVMFMQSYGGKLVINAEGNDVAINTYSPTTGYSLDVNGAIAHNGTIAARSNVPYITKIGAFTVGYMDITASFRLATGYLAGAANAANYNTVYGHFALSSAGSGGGNSLFGSYAGEKVTGDGNHMIGYECGKEMTNASWNVAMGYQALRSSSGSYNHNIMFGYQAGYSCAASGNIGIGNSSLRIVTGNYNVAIGFGAGYAMTSGAFNVLSGYSSGNVLTTGNYNVGLGSDALVALTTGSNNIGIGYNQNVVSNTGSNQMNIGGLIFGIGMTGNVSSPAGQVSIGANAPITNALLDLTSTTKAFYPMRMTTTQRDAMTSVVAGALIYNSTTNKHQGYNGSTWNDFF